MRPYATFFLLFILPFCGSAQDKKYTPADYIETYKSMAIKEMQRSGVPASITLAQGILESGCGNSELSKKANNHFGIKGHRNWTGECYYMDDDAKDECFRVYKSVIESYADHSDFLHSNTRYDFLFALRSTDYIGWAKGLKQAGYATDPMYADRLIKVIEKYELNQYDVEKKRKLFADKTGQTDVFEINGIPAIAFDGKMTIRQIRDKYYFAEWQIFKYNDFSNSQSLTPGAILYLRPKNNTNKTQKTHKVEKGESMFYISQLRGIKLKKLYKLNQLEIGEEPAPGEIIHLKSKREQKPNLAKGAEKPDFRFFTINSEDDLLRVAPKEKNPNEPVAEKRMIETEDGVYHQVAPGETLMSIARAYEMDWKTLRDQNNLKTNEVKDGQLLLIEPRAELAIESTEKVVPKANQGETVVKTSEEILNDNSTPNSEGNYVVKNGDSLYMLARMNGLTVAELMALNGLSEPKLSVGQSIKLK